MVVNKMQITVTGLCGIDKMRPLGEIIICVE